jgi:hypothetical protein
LSREETPAETQSTSHTKVGHLPAQSTTPSKTTADSPDRYRTKRRRRSVQEGNGKKQKSRLNHVDGQQGSETEPKPRVPKKGSISELNAEAGRVTSAASKAKYGLPSPSSPSPDVLADSDVLNESDYDTCPVPKRPTASPKTSSTSSVSRSADDTCQRERNRIAATKCRLKTKAATTQLTSDEHIVSQRHRLLVDQAASLREEVLHLKNLLLQHAHCDCVLIQQYLMNSARIISKCHQVDGYEHINDQDAAESDSQQE